MNRSSALIPGSLSAEGSLPRALQSARHCCSQRTSWKLPKNCATASASSTKAGSLHAAPWMSSRRWEKRNNPSKAFSWSIPRNEQLGALVRAGLKSNFGFSVFWHRLLKEKKDRWLVPVFGLSLLRDPSFLCLVSVIKEIYFCSSRLDRKARCWRWLFSSAAFILISASIIPRAFYFSRDIEMLIPLPVKPSEVLLSKFIVVTINEY